MNLVRGKNVDEALTILKFTPKAASEVIGKTIKSCRCKCGEQFRYG